MNFKIKQRDGPARIGELSINNKKCVFACGGGVVLKKENMKVIAGNSHVVYLMISLAEALNRLSGSDGRPLIKDDREENISRLLKERNDIYSKYADITINNDKISPEDAAREITNQLYK